MGTCSCGGRWRLAFNEVMPTRGRWLDRLRMRCAQCGRVAAYCFDITAFFVARPGVWLAAAQEPPGTL